MTLYLWQYTNIFAWRSIYNFFSLVDNYLIVLFIFGYIFNISFCKWIAC